MIRKKSSSKEENTGKHDDKQSEIKEDNEKTDTDDQGSDDEAINSDNAEQTTDAMEKEPEAADKVVSSEKTLEEKLAEMQDKYIRLSAEFDNYRKRTLREKIELSKYASENILLKLLPFMDDFERALKNIEDIKDCSAVKEGIDLIHTKFLEFLKQNGVNEVEALDSPFNYDLHDAVAKVKVEDDSKKGMVVEVIQKGYYLLDKVIRHSKVVVGE